MALQTLPVVPDKPRIALSVRGILRGASWAVAALVIVLHLAYRHPFYGDQAALYAGCLAAFAIVSVAYMRPHTLPVLPMMLSVYYFTMAAQVFSSPELRGPFGPIRLSSRSFDEALLAGVLVPVTGVVPFLLARRWGRRLAPRAARLLDDDADYTPEKSMVARTVAIASVLLNLATNMLGENGKFLLGDWQLMGAMFANPAFSLGLLYWDFKETRSFVARALFWTSAVVLTLIGIGTGLIGNAAVPALAAGLLIWRVAGRMPASFVVSVFVLLIALQSAKQSYRELTWKTGDTHTIGQRFENWSVALSKTYGREGREVDTFADSAEATGLRAGVLSQVAQIFEWVPHVTPHVGPELWLRLPEFYVPRVLWTEKPIFTVEHNDRYAWTFGLQTKEGVRSSTTTLPLIGDGYWRIGWPGVFIEAAVYALMYGLYTGLAVAPSRALIIASTLVVVRTLPDQDALVHVSSLPQHWVGITILMVGMQLLQALVRSTKQRPQGASSHA